MAISRPRPNVRVDDSLDGISAADYYEALTGWESSATTHVQCPFWDHRSNPAMMLYGRTWYCFACAKGGSIYEFGALLWGLDTRGADFLDLRNRLQRELGVI